MELAKILVVDDEPDICEVLRLMLEKRGYLVLTAANGRLALDEVSRNPDVDLVIMDILMPELSGIDACCQLRALCAAPVLFLSAKSQEADKESAFYSGGDDYLTKPFSPAELLRRVEALLRRYRVYQGKKTEAPVAGAFRLDPDGKCVFRNEEKVALTEREYELLAFLLTHGGQVLDNRTIYEQVWHEAYLPASANTVMVHMLKLRKKLEEDPSHPKLLKTVWGEGYRVES